MKIKKLTKKLLLISLILSIASCSGIALSGDKYHPPKPGESDCSNCAIINIYRPNSFLNHLYFSLVNIYIDDQKVSSLKTKGFIRLYVTPGHHKIKASSSLILKYSRNYLEDYFNENQEYFIRYDDNSFFSNGADIINIPTKTGKREMADFFLITTKTIK